LLTGELFSTQLCFAFGENLPKAFLNCPNLAKIEVYSSLCGTIVLESFKNTRINITVGNIFDVIENTGFLFRVSSKLFHLLGPRYDHQKRIILLTEALLFAEWAVCAKIEDSQGRLPLHIARESGLMWSDGSRIFFKGEHTYHCKDRYFDSFGSLYDSCGGLKQQSRVYLLLQNYPAER